MVGVAAANLAVGKSQKILAPAMWLEVLIGIGGAAYGAMYVWIAAGRPISLQCAVGNAQEGTRNAEEK